MVDALIVILAGYLGLTYLFGMYLAVRALCGRRLMQVLTGHGPRRLVRPLRVHHPVQPTPTPPASAGALGYVRKAAA